MSLSGRVGISANSFWLELPDELQRLTALGLGALILVALVIFHGAGLRRILVTHKNKEAMLTESQPHLLRPFSLVGWSVLLMLFLHVIEVNVWALILYSLGLIKGFHDAIYFSANAYTTLGYGDVMLDRHWRNIGPIIALSGMFCFALTTGALVAIAATLESPIKDRAKERK